MVRVVLVIRIVWVIGLVLIIRDCRFIWVVMVMKVIGVIWIIELLGCWVISLIAMISFINVFSHS